MAGVWDQYTGILRAVIGQSEPSTNLIWHREECRCLSGFMDFMGDLLKITLLNEQMHPNYNQVRVENPSVV